MELLCAIRGLCLVNLEVATLSGSLIGGLGVVEGAIESQVKVFQAYM